MPAKKTAKKLVAAQFMKRWQWLSREAYRILSGLEDPQAVIVVSFEHCATDGAACARSMAQEMVCTNARKLILLNGYVAREAQRWES